MGVDPSRSSPIFFAKPAQSAVQGDRIEYPPDTLDLHHEVELAVLIGEGGRGIRAADWMQRIWGFAVAVDLTRRDAQARFKAAGQPWELSKGFDQSAPMGLVTRACEWLPSPETTIELRVNGQPRQRGTLGDMIWPVPELLEELSGSLTLNTGDVILTGTPAGVGPIERGDLVEARVQGLAGCRIEIS